MSKKRKKNNLKFNIVANFLIRLWSVVSNFLFVPLYIKFLGEEAYGLVTFFSSLQTVMNLLGMGLTKTLRREFASLGNDDNARLEKYKLLRSVETVYGFIAIIIVLICSLGSELIAAKWLSIDNLSIFLVKSTISLMGVSIAIQLITGMLQGCLFGLEKQVEADAIQFGWSFLRNVGVILLLWLFSIDLIEFYLWYIAIDILYLIVLRIRVIHYLKNDSYKLIWKFKEIENIKKIWKYALGLFFISICTIGFDKLIVSKFFDLVTVGAYNTIVMLGNFSLIISTSVGIAVFSRFAVLKSEGKTDELNTLYKNTNYAVNICVGCFGAFIATFSKEIILFWTNSPKITSIADTAAQFIIIGLTFQALQQTSFEFMLSTGVVGLDNVRAIATVIALVVIMPIMINICDFLGAAQSVFVIFTLVSLIYVGCVNWKYIKRNPIKAVLFESIIPFILPYVIANIVHMVVDEVIQNNFLKCIIGAITGAITLGCYLFIVNKKLSFISTLKKSKQISEVKHE